ncbi:ChbG/HpnK family deacetylase, partial [Acinetobacter baumannii]
ASLAHRLDASALRDEIATQCALFEDATGRAPDYVDGHQHVHQLPQIREALVEVLVARYTGRLPRLRIRGARIGDGDKPLFIAARGAE